MHFYYLDEFEKWGLENFDFLLKEEYFEKYSSDKDQYQYSLSFFKKGMIVCISYSLKNDYIDVNIFRDPEKFAVVPPNYDESVSLGNLAAYNGQPYTFYNSFMPEKIGMENSLQEVAKLFKQLAMDIIRGKEWVSINMVRKGARKKTSD
jgi:hypothetical protein